LQDRTFGWLETDELSIVLRYKGEAEETRISIEAEYHESLQEEDWGICIFTDANLDVCFMSTRIRIPSRSWNIAEFKWILKINPQTHTRTQSTSPTIESHPFSAAFGRSIGVT
jgi:hypothetical protein